MQDFDELWEIEEPGAQGNIGERKAIRRFAHRLIFKMNGKSVRYVGASGFERVLHQGETIADVHTQADVLAAQALYGLEFLGDALVLMVFDRQTELPASQDRFGQLQRLQTGLFSPMEFVERLELLVPAAGENDGAGQTRARCLCGADTLFEPVNVLR